MSKASLVNIPSYYVPFIEKVAEDELLQALKRGGLLFQQFAELLPANKGDYAYAEGKWSVKQLLQHIIDTERVFNYRAMAIARGDQQDLQGYDHNAYAVAVDLGHKSIASLGQEFSSLRKSTLSMFQSFSSTELNRRGVANGLDLSVEMIGFMSEGHLRHHLDVLQERYL